MDVAAALETVDVASIAKGKEQLRAIVAMLIGLSKWAENNTSSNDRRA